MDSAEKGPFRPFYPHLRPRKRGSFGRFPGFFSRIKCVGVTPDVLMNHVAMRKPGSKVDLVILRDDKRRNITITLGTRP